MHFQKLLAFLFVINLSCQKKTSTADNVVTAGFEETPLAKPVIPGILDEASGIADSKLNPGYLWVQQDSGNPNDIALVSYNGTFLKKLNIKTGVNRDWEDMALANGPVAGNNYIYLADIGDNGLAFAEYYIYRFAEPGKTLDTVPECDKIIFKYADGPHDADAIMVDNTTKDIYIITKQDAYSAIYKLSFPQSTTTVNMAILSGTLSFNGVTSAAFSPDGKEVLIKTYNDIYYWKKGEETLELALTKTPVNIPHGFEPQGEAICFKNDNSGFFTLSERPSVIAAVNLNFYKRK